MKVKTFFKIFMIFFLFFALQTAFCEELLSEQTSQIEEKKTEITIRCSVPGVYVFLDGELQGKTELKIRNLREGIYNLKLEKKGFETQFFEIEVKKSLSQTFYVEMKKANKE